MSARASQSACLAMLACILLIPSAAAAKTIYVDDDATGANDGTSWGDAYFYLQDALMFAVAGDEIRVAQGVYRPDDFVLSDRPSRGREETFELINGVTLKGGYAGLGQADPSARDVGLYRTTLSGDLDGDDVGVSDPCDLASELTRMENSYHVVTAYEVNEAAVLDGFTIYGGNTIGSSEDGTRGGGVYCGYRGHPVLVGCMLRGNLAYEGGGVFGGGTFVDCMFVENSADAGGGVYGGDDFTNCRFVRNSASESGGGIYGGGRLNGCTFSHNSAGLEGGAINAFDSYGTVISNCIFEDNSSARRGGAANLGYETDATLTYCVFRRNSAEYGGAINSSWDTSLALSGCTFAENSASASGGGLWSSISWITLTKCSFTGNIAGESGGGIWSTYDWLTLANCSFRGNWAGGAGAGVFHFEDCYSSQVLFSNCTFVGNSAKLGDALACAEHEEYNTCSARIKVANCILWDSGNEIWNDMHAADTIVTSSDIRGGISGIHDPCEAVVWGEGNIDADPCFADSGYWDANGTLEDANDDFWVDGDYHLRSQGGRWDANEGGWTTDEVTSPCIDAGDPMTPVGLEPFPNGGIVNMGAYGGTAEASKSYFGKAPCEVIVAGDVNGDGVVDFRDFRIMALHWMWEDVEGMN